MEISRGKILFIMLCLLVFLYSSNFMGYSEILPIIVTPIILLMIPNIKFSKRFITTLVILVFFLLNYNIISYLYGFSTLFSSIGKTIFAPLLMTIGYCIAGLDSKNNYNSFIIILSLVIGSFLYGFGSLLKSINMYGNYSNVISSLNGRFIADLWSSEFITATVINASVSMGLSIAGLLLYRLHPHFILNYFSKFFILIIFIGSIYISGTIGNRTGIMIALICFLIILLLKFSSNNKSRILIFISTISIFIISSFFYQYNILGIKSSLKDLFIFERFSSSDFGGDPRFDAWLTTVLNFNQNLNGGRNIELNLSYVHNLWLDVFYDSGLIPFILLMIFTLLSLITLLQFLKLKINLAYKALIIGLFAAFYLTFAVEPIMQGFNIYFTCFCFVLGIMQRKLIIEQ